MKVSDAARRAQQAINALQSAYAIGGNNNQEGPGPVTFNTPHGRVIVTEDGNIFIVGSREAAFGDDLRDIQKSMIGGSAGQICPNCQGTGVV